MRKRESGEQANQAAFDIIPTTQHILDNYNVLTTEEKNRLWKLVLRKVTAYRTPEGELSVHIYPKLPKVIQYVKTVLLIYIRGTVLIMQSVGRKD